MKTYIIWRQDDGRSYSSLTPSEVRSIAGLLSRRAVERIAQDATVYVLTLLDGELSVEKLEPVEETAPVQAEGESVPD